ncbi:MAG: hypothetical protein AB7O24_11670 [Kofleriaceae bacterium]
MRSVLVASLLVGSAASRPAVAGEAQIRFTIPTIGELDAPREDAPAPHVDIIVNGVPQTTDADGGFQWDGDEPATVTLSATGPNVQVIADTGTPAAKTVTVGPGEIVAWDARADELVDSQLATFIYMSRVRSWAVALVPDATQPARVKAVVNNDSENCGGSAAAGGLMLHVGAPGACINPGLSPDTIYHEFGHVLRYALHGRSPDEAVTEAVGDSVAVTLLDEPLVLRGYYGELAGITRNVSDPNKVWPDDGNTGDGHEDGLILSGALWDLREILITDQGTDAGRAHYDRLLIEVIRSTTDMLSAYRVVLEADDDDGDLANGTPAYCAIHSAFAAHGLAILEGIEPSIACSGDKPDGMDEQPSDEPVPGGCTAAGSPSTLAPGLAMLLAGVLARRWRRRRGR